MRTSNPVLARPDVFGQLDTSPATLDRMWATPARMTVDDVVVRTAALLALVVVSGGVAVLLGLDALALPAALVGFALALVITFKRSVNVPLILLYAVVEGVFLGAITHVFNAIYPGIALQAVVGTAGCFGGTLLAYKAGILKATPRFTRMIVGAMLGILAIYLVNLVLRLFGGQVPFLNDSGPVGILISLVIVAVASLSFVLDFAAIEEAVAAGAPEREAWRGAFGLVVGLVWLYLEMLRLLAKLREQ